MDKKFIEELADLCSRHEVLLSGNLRILKDSEHTTYDKDSLRIETAPYIDTACGRDTCGPFIVFTADIKHKEWVPFERGKAFNYVADYQAYDCPITGEIIEGRASHRENLKKHGCRILEKGEREHITKTREQELEKQIERQAEHLTGVIAQRMSVEMPEVN